MLRSRRVLIGIAAILIFTTPLFVRSIQFGNEVSLFNASVNRELSKEEVVKIALSNESVKELIGGKERTVVSVAKYGEVYYVTIDGRKKE